MMKMLIKVWLEETRLENSKQQLKNACLNKSQKIEAAVFLFGDHRWKVFKTYSACESLANRCPWSSLSSAIGSNLDNGRQF